MGMIGSRSKQSGDSAEDQHVGGPSTVLSVDSDILWLVLQRLPLRVLFQCKSVCRIWNSVISSPRFRHQFLSSPAREAEVGSAFVSMETVHSPPQEESLQSSPACSTSRLVFSYANKQKQAPDNVELEDANSLKRCFPVAADIVASSCGVLLLVNSNDHCQYLVHNTLTGATDELPPTPTSDAMCLVTFMCREPQEDCDSNYEFEVVRIPDPRYRSGDANGQQMETYSSRTRQWLKLSLPQQRVLWSRRSNDILVFFKRTIYWSLGQEEFGVFDPATGRMEEPPLPPCRRLQYDGASPSLGSDASRFLLYHVNYGNNVINYMLLLRPCVTRAIFDGETNTDQVMLNTSPMDDTQLNKEYQWVFRGGSQGLWIPYNVPSWPFHL